MQRFGNLTYGPNDDPDGDGTTNMQEYQHEGGTPLDGGAGGVTQPDDSAAYEMLILVLLTLVGVLAGVVVLQVARNRELRRRLDERRLSEFRQELIFIDACLFQYLPHDAPAESFMKRHNYESRYITVN